MPKSPQQFRSVDDGIEIPFRLDGGRKPTDIDKRNANGLGAVMPLTNFANFLAIPIAVFASTFRNELTSLAVLKALGCAIAMLQTPSRQRHG